MLSMMTNKSRRLLRRASTRNNLLRKEREKYLLEEEARHTQSDENFSFVTPCQENASDLTAGEEFDNFSNASSQPRVSLETSNALLRSSSCTNVFFTHRLCDARLAAGRLGEVLRSENDLSTSSLNDIRCGRGTVRSCKDSPCSLRSRHGSTGDSRNGLDKSVAHSIPEHCIDLRVQMTLPKVYDNNVDQTKLELEEQTKQGLSKDQPKDGKVLNSDAGEHREVEGKNEDERQIHNQQHDKANSQHRSQTLQRSRSCSFIISLNYQLNNDNSIGTKDSPGHTSLADHSNTICNAAEGTTFTNSSSLSLNQNNISYTADTHFSSEDLNINAKEINCVRKLPDHAASETNVNCSMRQFRKLKKSRSLLHFAGFSRDAESGIVNSGRKSTIMENDGEDEGEADECASHQRHSSNNDTRDGNDGVAYSISNEAASEGTTPTKDKQLYVAQSSPATAVATDEQNEVTHIKHHLYHTVNSSAQFFSQTLNNSREITVADCKNNQDPAAAGQHRCDSILNSEAVESDFKSLQSQEKVYHSSNQTQPIEDKCHAEAQQIAMSHCPLPNILTAKENQDKVATLVQRSRISVTAGPASTTGSLHTHQITSTGSHLVPHPPDLQLSQTSSPSDQASSESSLLQSRVSTLSKALGVLTKRICAPKEKNRHAHSFCSLENGQAGFISIQQSLFQDSYTSHKESEVPEKQLLRVHEPSPPVYSKLVPNSNVSSEALNEDVPIARSTPAKSTRDTKGRNHSTPQGRDDKIPSSYRDRSCESKHQRSSLLPQRQKLRHKSFSPESTTSTKKQPQSGVERFKQDDGLVSKEKSHKYKNNVKQFLLSKKSKYKIAKANEETTKPRSRHRAKQAANDKVHCSTSKAQKPETCDSAKTPDKQDRSQTCNFTGFYRVLPPIEPVTVNKQIHKDKTQTESSN